MGSIINKVILSIVQCISALSRIIPYISAPNGIPPLEIILTNEKTRDIYSFGVACCIKRLYWNGDKHITSTKKT